MLLFLKRNFIFIFLGVSSMAMGVLAFSTALQLREFRKAGPQKSQALTPTCRFTFTISDTTPRKEAAATITIFPLPTQLLAEQPSITPTVTTEPTSTPKITPTIKATATPTLIPTLTPKKTIGAPQISPTPTLKPSPTSTYLAQASTNTPTPTPRLISSPSPTPTSKSTPTPTVNPNFQTGGILTASPTSVLAPELPVSGISLPTLVGILLGLTFLGIGVFSGVFYSSEGSDAPAQHITPH